MTCQHCQTWVLDGEHRCHRCGRRIRNTPSRISPNSYPIAATATARAYDFAEPIEEAALDSQSSPNPSPLPGQQLLFTVPLVDPRVIPFDSLTTPTERQSIRARAAELQRPAPLKSGTVEVRRARPRKVDSSSQRRLEFSSEQNVMAPPQSSIICDAPVAPVTARLEAAATDLLFIAAGCLFGVAAFNYVGGHFTVEKHSLPFFAMALSTVILAYKLIWLVTGCDSPGMRRARLCLVDFDGNPPSQGRRYSRFFSSILSLLAAGVGLAWSLVDEDRLTWHDHISSTFPTFVDEN